MTLRTLALSLAVLTSSCAFHSTATEWHGRVGADGQPVFLKSSTTVGLNLFVALKVIGGTDTSGMIDELTGAIAAEDGDYVRMVESSSENYWYGVPPFTWFLTPVVTTVRAEYHPSAEELAKIAPQAASPAD